jgi:hypothetical protein
VFDAEAAALAVQGEKRLHRDLDRCVDEHENDTTTGIGVRFCENIERVLEELRRAGDPGRR